MLSLTGKDPSNDTWKKELDWLSDDINRIKKLLKRKDEK